MKSERQKKYDKAYDREHYEQINLTPPKGTKAKLKSYAERDGQSLTAYILKTVDEYERNRKP